MISTTAATMTSEASSDRGVRVSPPKAQPSNTATMGFTYPAVATLLGVLTCSSQAKAVKATSDPKTSR